MIEYQGKQHYTCEQNGWNNKEHLLLTQKHDEMKKEYCKQNNIKLIEIPYYDYDKIDWEYLKEVVFKWKSYVLMVFLDNVRVKILL